MSNKGKVFTREDLPRGTQQRIKNKQASEDELARLDKWLADQTERNKVVAVDKDGGEITAEELPERAMRIYAQTDEGTIDPVILARLRDLAALTVEQRSVVLNAFDMDAELANPFAKPPKKAKK